MAKGCHSQCDDSVHAPYSKDLSPTDFSLFLFLKIAFKGHRFASAEEATSKSMKALRELSKNDFPGMLPKALRTLVKVCHCPRELHSNKCCVIGSNIAYAFVTNQFREFLELLYFPITENVK
jgi:hypothetical protein